MAKINMLMPEDLQCTREAYLKEKDEQRAFEKEWRDCKRRRRYPGYEKIMSNKYEPPRR